MTLVLVTHDPALAARCSRQVAMRSGRIEAAPALRRATGMNGAGDAVRRRTARRSPLRFSLREMRGGLSGFLIFLTCIALGVAAIGGVNSVARSITAGVANEGQALLGGDMRFELNQREASDAGAGLSRRARHGRRQRQHALDGAARGRLRPGAGRS